MARKPALGHIMRGASGIHADTRARGARNGDEQNWTGSTFIRAEVAPDGGDLKMLEVLRALGNVGYGGVIDYDHVMKLIGDRLYGIRYVPCCVGYMKGLPAAVQQRGTANHAPRIQRNVSDADG